MIAKRPSRSRTRRALSDAPPVGDARPPSIPEPPVPPSSDPLPIPPAPTVARGSAKTQPVVLVVVGVMLMAAVVLGVMQFAKKGNAKPIIAQTVTAELPKAQIPADIIARVAKHFSVNRNELPTIATVQDPELLRQQNAAFYREAEVGDQLLVWSDKVVLYSVKRDVVLNALPIAAQPVAAVAPQAPEAANIEVRNGTGVPGVGKTVAQKLTADGLSVLPATVAKGKAYEKTVIAVPAGKSYPETIAKLQTALGVHDVAVVPAAEVGVTGDILVVIGQDYKN